MFVTDSAFPCQGPGRMFAGQSRGAFQMGNEL